MTLATKITLARIVLIVPTVVFYVLAMFFDNLYMPFIIVSCILFSVLCATDFVDGHIARKTNTVSALGKFLDPLADKIVIVVMLFLIVCFDDIRLFPYDSLVIALLGGLILTRELTVSVFRAVAASKGLVLAADIYGKIKTVLLDVGVALLILGGFHIVLAAIAEAIFYLGAVMTVVSGVNYLIKNKHVLADPEKKEQAPAAADVKEAAADKVENENDNNQTSKKTSST